MIINRSFWQYLLPTHSLSILIGKLARCKIIWFKNFLIDLFIKQYKIDMHEAIEKNPHNYDDLENFFIRKVNPKKRLFPTNKNAIGCPVDGKISQFGKITKNSIIQAKGKNFSISELLGDNNTDQYNFINGNFATIYLAPHNYHRVYMPFDGILKKMIYVPGKLFSVSNTTAKNIPNLFARNERVILIFETAIGKIAVILVGAMIISGINTTWHGKITKEKSNSPVNIWEYQDKNKLIKRGEELGYFTFGSTVILLFQKDKITFNKRTMKKEKEIKIGQLLATQLS